jgi:hypothetical protein
MKTSFASNRIRDVCSKARATLAGTAIVVAVNGESSCAHRSRTSCTLVGAHDHSATLDLRRRGKLPQAVRIRGKVVTL